MTELIHSGKRPLSIRAKCCQKLAWVQIHGLSLLQNVDQAFRSCLPNRNLPLGLTQPGDLWASARYSTFLGLLTRSKATADKSHSRSP